MKTVTIGNVEVTALLDTNLLMNPRTFLPTYADDIIREYGDILDERELMQVSITCYLIRSSGKNVLIDTGLGGRRRPRFPVGHLDESLKEAGIAADEIDTIVHTHLHIDHVGWNTVDDENSGRRIFFPNATYLIQQVEWDYWMTPAQLAEPANAHLVECVEPLESTGRIKLLTTEQPIDANLTFIPTPGHTPGHVSIGIYSGGERAVVIGDASHHPMQLNHPDWSPAVDTDPKQSATSRDGLFEEAAANGHTWIAGHWEYPGFGRIKRLDGRRVFQAL
jgi:glyoxylase-like metal-dependent hydrolase (beta-lactamase superfamily II)